MVYLLVGAGTAGCAVAARLAETGRHTVLLIGEGGIPHPDFEVPALSTNLTLMMNPNYVKIYPSVPQSNAARAQNGTITFLLGKTMGGSSSINGMWLNRGHPQDYDNWARLTGDESWSYVNLLKYFKKYEAYTGNNPTDQRGFNGPITISPSRHAPGLAEWLQGAAELGYPIRDPNGPQTESFTWIDFSQRAGRRVSSFKGYVEPMFHSKTGTSHSGRSNLLILTQTTANRILFDGNRAVGVKFTSNSTGGIVKGYARAMKEIIVTAGVMDSAALLMRSGVGPKSVLERSNIPAVRYLPTGRNLQDHIIVPSQIIFGNRSAALDPERDLTPDAWRTFQESGEGPYSSYLGSGGQAFVTSSSLLPYERLLGWPDLHLIYTSNGNYAVPSTPVETDVRKWEISVLWNAILVRPKSRGMVTLDPRNIDNPPVIDFKFLTHPDDMRALLDGHQIMLKLCEETVAFQRIGCRIPTTPLPACNQLRFRSDQYWKCYVRQTTTTGLHGAGTCKMGSGPEDSDAVVDTELRVIGLKALRVADASVMPTVTDTNTQGAVYVIAEKAADMILQKWNKPNVA